VEPEVADPGEVPDGDEVSGRIKEHVLPPGHHIHLRLDGDLSKSMFFRLVIIYIFGSTVIFQLNIGSWYGWLVGGVVGFVLSRVMVKAQRHWLGLGS
jgi:hypothetical protein